jgi:hypothetical protein
MKALIVLAAALSALPSFATEIRSDRKSAQVNAGRVTQVIPLVRKTTSDFDGFHASITVVDMGGTTDVSPTQRAFFTLYLKGEMFSTDASFELPLVFHVKSAKKISGGVYQVVATMPDENAMPKTYTLTIDAVKAIRAIQAVRCDDFDCPASENFESSIDVKGLPADIGT